MGFPGGSEVKASACNAGDLGSIPGSGRSPGEGNGNPLPWTENPMDGESHGWRSLVGYSPWGRKESVTTERLHSLIPLLVTFLYVISCSCCCTPKEVFRDLWDFLALLRSHSNSLDE